LKKKGKNTQKWIPCFLPRIFGGKTFVEAEADAPGRQRPAEACPFGETIQTIIMHHQEFG